MPRLPRHRQSTSVTGMTFTLSGLLCHDEHQAAQAHVHSVSVENYRPLLAIYRSTGSCVSLYHYSHAYEAELPLHLPTHAPASMTDNFQKKFE
jgi:hypothetical protein